VQELFHAAAELDATGREAFLKRECGDDAPLLSEVLALLAEDAKGGSLLDRDLRRVAQQVLADSSVLPTQRFGPYRVLQMLGEGGMGVVYLAERGHVLRGANGSKGKGLHAPKPSDRGPRFDTGALQTGSRSTESMAAAWRFPA